MDASDQLKQRVLRIAALATGVLTIGMVGYRLVSHGASSWIDCLYMVVITVSTIGYGEIIPLDHNPVGRVFTMGLALFGIGIITYVMGTVTQAAVDGDLQKRWRKRRMQKAIDQLSGHYVIGGWSDLVPSIARELRQTGRPFVLIVADRAALAALPPDGATAYIIEGDPTDEDTLRRAGLPRAAGVFAADAADHSNIVICLAARGLNPDARIVAVVGDGRHAGKLKKVGASAVVSAVHIGALRMSSEMLRPATVTFLDTMLRSETPTLRIEDLPVGAAAGGKSIGELALARYGQTVLLALRRQSGWVFNPAAAEPVAAGDVLVVMTTAEERQRLAADLA